MCEDGKGRMFPPGVAMALVFLGLIALVIVAWIEVSERGALQAYRSVFADWPLPPRGYRLSPQPLLLTVRSLVVLLAYAVLIGLGMMIQVWRTPRRLIAKILISVILLVPILGATSFALLSSLPKRPTWP